MRIEPTETVASLAVHHPHAVRVFERHQIDYCCGGDRSLAEVCERAGLQTDVLLDEIEQARPTSDDTDWSARSLSELIDFILVRYHRPLDEELPRLEKLANKVTLVHGHRDPERFEALVDTVSALRVDLEQHMAKEEQVLFPWIRAGQGADAGGPIQVMRMEHDAAGDFLVRLRQLTNDYDVPEEACGSWRALWSGLETLEHELHEHIHLENNVLFPRALDGE